MNTDRVETMQLSSTHQDGTKQSRSREASRRAQAAAATAHVLPRGRHSVMIVLFSAVMFILIAVFGALAVGWIDANTGVLLLFAAMFLAAGVGLIGGARRVSKWRMKAERSALELAAVQDELLVARESLARQQQALVQAEKMAAMGRMAAGVAHEIANPLASMDSILQLAQRRAATSDGRAEQFLDRPEMVDALREQVSRINRIVNQLTNFAHPNGEHRRTISTCDLVRQSLDMLRFDHRLREVDVRCECAAAAGAVRVVPQQMHQVLVNLVLNALDALADVNEPRVTIRTRAQHGWSIIEIADNGPGISPQHLGRVFEPFFTTKPPGCGTGLGLSICATIVQQHGGRIAVDSTLGNGATFTITLPSVSRGRGERTPASGSRVQR